MNSPSPLTQSSASSLAGTQPGSTQSPAGLPLGPTLLRGELPLGPLSTTELAELVPNRVVREHYRRIWRGMYRRADQVDDLLLRSRALARTCPDGVLFGRSAALFWGDDSVPADALPEIWLPGTRRAREGRIYRSGDLPPSAVTEVDGLRVTTPLRTCRDLAIALPFEDAVVAIERLCAMVAELPAQLSAAVEHPSGRTSRKFERVVRARDPLSPTALSTRVRMLLADAGCGDFSHGHVVGPSRTLSELPLADPVAKCAIFTRTFPASPGGLAGGQAGGKAGGQPGGSTGGQPGGTPVGTLPARLQRAGWSVIIVRERKHDRASASPRQRPSLPGPAMASAHEVQGVPRRAAALLAARWPGTELRLPAAGDPADDPYGIWQ